MDLVEDRVITFQHLITILGNTFNNSKEICDYFNVPNSYWRTRIYAGIEPEAAMCESGSLSRNHIDDSGVAWYNVEWSKEPVTTAMIIEHNRPDLLDIYNNFNPDHTYKPFGEHHYIPLPEKVEVKPEVEDEPEDKQAYDVFGNHFDSEDDLLKYYGISKSEDNQDIQDILDSDLEIEVKVVILVENLYNYGISLEFISLEGLSYYSISDGKPKLYTTVELLNKLAPKWVDYYTKYNPYHKYHAS